MRALLRRFLAVGLALAVLVPMVAVVVLGLAALLSSLGDAEGAAFCRRLGLVAGAVWFLALAVTATAGGIVAFEMLCSGPARHSDEGADRQPGKDA